MIKFVMFLTSSSFFLISGCSSLQPVNDTSLQLEPENGYIALIFSSKFNLRMVEIYATENSQPNIHISYILKGDNLFLYKLPSGMYCIKRYAIAETDVKILDGGICFEVVPEMLNYPGHIIASYNNTYFHTRKKSFIEQIKQHYPVLCKDFLVSLCYQKILEKDKKIIRLSM